MRCKKLILVLLVSSMAFGYSVAYAQQADYDRDRQTTRSQRDDDRYENDERRKDRDDNYRNRNSESGLSPNRDRNDSYSDDSGDNYSRSENFNQRNNSQNEDRDQRRTSQRDDVPAGLGVTITQDDNDRVRVQRVFRDSPADEAGLRSNDEIVRVDEQRIDSPRQLISVIRRKDPGSSVSVQIRRNGQTRTLLARLEPRQEALPNRFTQRRSQSQGRYYGDQNTPHGQDDLMEHIDNLQRQVDRMSRELDELRAMLGDDPSNRDWEDRTRNSYSQN